VQVVVVPIARTDDERGAVEAAIEPLERELAGVVTASGPLRWQVDRREESPGFKFNHWELRGVPLRLEIGPRDVAAGQAVLVRRLDRGKETLPLGEVAAGLPERLAAYQRDVFQRAVEFRAANSHEVDDYDTFKATVEEQGGFLFAHWCGDSTCERQINEETGATIRVIPFESSGGRGTCLVDGRASSQRVLFARAY
jgi:prolyl-tRNA synthetase